MTPVLQVIIGFGIGLLGALLLTPLAIGYTNHNSRSRRNKSTHEFWSEPGEICPICLETFNSNDMQYLRCGHALHDKCYEECKRHTKQCPTCREPM